MQISANQIEEENQLFWLLRVTRVAMKRLSKHTLITKADWETLDLAWHAAHANDVAARKPSTISTAASTFIVTESWDRKVLPNIV